MLVEAESSWHKPPSPRAGNLSDAGFAAEKASELLCMELNVWVPSWILTHLFRVPEAGRPLVWV